MISLLFLDFLVCFFSLVFLVSVETRLSDRSSDPRDPLDLEVEGDAGGMDFLVSDRPLETWLSTFFSFFVANGGVNGKLAFFPSFFGVETALESSDFLMSLPPRVGRP